MDTRELWSKVDKTCQEIMELDPADRQLKLEELKLADLLVYEEVCTYLKLLDSDSSSGFLQTPAVHEAAQVIKRHGVLPVEPVPDKVGPFPIIERIGQGGMGSVYRARQLSPERQVALKIISPTDRREFIARFQYEYQALADMNSPYIAQVYDAGVTRDHRPYFTMELVEGLPVIEYCDKHKLSMGQRLALFLKVCEGVRHAHNRGLIHRDLKPTNILVLTDEHSGGHPKIIDFGIAKAMGERAVHATVAGLLVGTPAYMSPEQAQGSDIDTAADVYALGIILYELFCGFLPLDEAVYQDSSPANILKVIQELEAPRPSHRFAREPAEKKAKAAANRRTSPDALRRSLKSDLERIILKAIEKDRNRRYGTITELTEDIRRYQEHKPVKAAHPGLFYTTGKFLRRNRTVSSFVFLVLLSSTIAIHSKLSEVRSKLYASGISQTLTQIVSGNDPRNNVKAELDEIALAIDQGSLTRDLEISLHNSLGNVYTSRDFYVEAMLEFKKALVLLGNQAHQSSSLYSEINYNLGNSYLRQNRLDEAEILFEEVLPLQLENKDELYKAFNTMNLLADILYKRDCHLQASELFDQTLLYQLPFLEPQNSLNDDGSLTREDAARMNEALVTISNMLKLLIREDPEKAIFWGFIAKEYRDRYFGPDNPNSYDAALRLGLAMKDMPEYQDLGLYYLQQVYQNWRRIYGLNHRDTLAAANNLGRRYRAMAHFYERQGKFESAASMLAAGDELFREALAWAGPFDEPGENRTNWLSMMNNRAEILLDKGLFDEALALKLQETHERAKDPGDEDGYYFGITTGQIYEAMGRNDDAYTIYRHSFEALFQIYHGTRHPRLLESSEILLLLMIRTQRYQEAIDLIEPVLVSYRNGDLVTQQAMAPTQPFSPFLRIISGLKTCYLRSNQAQEAREFSQMYQDGSIQ